MPHIIPFGPDFDMGEALGPSTVGRMEPLRDDFVWIQEHSCAACRFRCDTLAVFMEHWQTNHAAQ